MESNNYIIERNIKSREDLLNGIKLLLESYVKRTNESGDDKLINHFLELIQHRYDNFIVRHEYVDGNGQHEPLKVTKISYLIDHVFTIKKDIDTDKIVLESYI
jgi:hypothetical protein